jgi:hypothetical protein
MANSQPQSRREFMRRVGVGMVTASVGSRLAGDLGFSTAFADDGPDRLSFGRLEPLVALMQETPAGRILPALSERVAQGTSLRDLVAAAALANSRAFGGEDYVGFHTLMALTPAYHMSSELPEARRALPIFKVLYRNTNRIQEHGGVRNEVLHPVSAGMLPQDRNAGEVLREQVRGRQINPAEQTLAAIAARDADEAFNSMVMTVQDATEVHRVVLPYRAWDLVGLIGREQALTLLRNSLRYCLRSESNERYVQSLGPVRGILPRLLEQHHLLDRPLGTRRPEDAWVDRFSRTLFASSPDQAAGAVAEALADGIEPEVIGEAISLGANQLVLRDEGRPARQAAPNRPIGSVHGDGIGVHASDSANAWRNMSRLGNPRNKAACLILAGYQLAQDRSNRGGDFLNWQPYPRAEARDRFRDSEPEAVLRHAEEAIRNRDQAGATAAIHRYGELGHPPRAAFDLLLKYAVSEDGALHAEKYYRTVCEDYAATRAAFRWRHVVGLARVTASAYGQPAPGYEEACRLVGA